MPTTRETSFLDVIIAAPTRAQFSPGGRGEESSHQIAAPQGVWHPQVSPSQCKSRPTMCHLGAERWLQATHHALFLPDTTTSRRPYAPSRICPAHKPRWQIDPTAAFLAGLRASKAMVRRQQGEARVGRAVVVVRVRVLPCRPREESDAGAEQSNRSL